ncbi:MAG: glycosyltransferase family 4 protein [Methylocystis sp.]
MSIPEAPLAYPFQNPSEVQSRSGPIVILIDSSGIGGIERHVAILARGLRRLEFDARIALLADHGPNAWLSQLENLGLPYDILDGGIGGLLSTLRREKVALLHTHGYKAGILGRLAARLIGAPVVSTFHAGEVGAFPVSFYQRADEWSSFLATRISVGAQISSRLPFPSNVIPNFIDAPSAPPIAPLPQAIGFVGRLSPEKGPEIFCEVASRHRGQAEWHVYGDGRMRRELERAYSEHVVFHGAITDIDQAWRRLGLLIISSYAEGLPMVALEALASGIPVAAAAVGALPDIIRHGENGWLFEAGDIEALDRIVEQWNTGLDSNGPLWRASAWRTVREKFGVELGIERTMAVYRAAGLRTFNSSP